jgi:hypothetical protein
MSFLKHCTLLCALVLSLSTIGYAQSSDNTSNQDSTSSQKKKAKNPQNILANKAARMSAIVPGLGQGYNKKYWKIPVIYVGAAVITYFAITNNVDYYTFKEAYEIRSAGGTDNYVNVYTQDQLKLLRDDARRYRDMSLIFGAGLYALNIIDAYVDRHLMEFDVSDDLSMHVKPFLYTANYRQFAPGLTLNFALKK